MFLDVLAEVECEAGEHYFCVDCGHESGRALHVRNMSDANTSEVKYAWTATVSHRTHRSRGADMKGGHAHEESAVIAVFSTAIIACVDYVVDFADGHPFKVLGYFGVFIVIYAVAHIWRKSQWQ